MKGFLATAAVGVLAGLSSAEWIVQQGGVGTVFLGLQMLDANVGWSAGFTNGIGNVMLKTTDGGDSLNNVLNDPGLTMMSMGTAAQSNSSAISCGYGLVGSVSVGTFTRDGGNTWGAALENGKALNGATQSCTASPSCYYLVGGYGNAISQKHGVARSCDGGENYEVFDWGIDMTPRYASFVNDTYGFVSGGNWPTSATKSRLHLSGDSHRRHSPERDRDVMFLTDSITVSTPKRSLALYSLRKQMSKADDYQAVIGRTYDGGETWEEIFRSEGEYYFNQIQFLNANLGFVVGENNRDGNGVILKTEDGGNTWRQVFQTDKSLMAVHMVNDKEGWVGGAVFAVGMVTYLVRTVDGGETWEEYPSELRHFIGEFSGPDPDHVWAMGFNQATSSLLQWIPE